METDTFGQPNHDLEHLCRKQELEFRHAVQKGLDSLERKDRVPLDEARRLLPLWVSKYSSDGSLPSYGSNPTPPQ